MADSLFFRADGTVEALYTEAIDLSKLGRLSVQRASTIEYDEKGQRWVVVVGAEEIFADPSRQKCLEVEHEYFNCLLKGEQLEKDIVDVKA